MVPELTVSVEPWGEMRDAILPLWDMLGEEAEQVARTPVPQGDMAIYDGLGAVDALISIGIRDSMRLIGFWLGFLSPHPHFHGRLACAADVVFLAPEYRGGWTMARAFRLLRDEAKARGASVLYANSPIGRDLGPLFRRFGLAPVEVQYSVWF